MLRNNLFQDITTAIDNRINSFIVQLSDKYKIPKDDIMKLWGDDYNSDTVSVKSDAFAQYNTDNVHKCKRDELVALCKKYKLKVSGKKDELIMRLLDVLPKNTQTSVQITKPEVSMTKRPRKKDEKQVVLSSKLIPKKRIEVRPNKFGNYEHTETHLIFNIDSKKVIGVQNEDGTIHSITKEDIDKCHQYNFEFETPENLNERAGKEIAEDGIVVDGKGKIIRKVDHEIDEEEFSEEEELEDAEEIE